MALDAGEYFLRVKDLSVHFGGSLVLDRIRLEAVAGRITCLLGRSGSGKTTFLRSINRLNDELGATTKGSAHLLIDSEWKDVLLPETDLPALRRRVGMVFQTPNLLPASIAKNILIPLKLTTGLDKTQRLQRMREALEHAWLWEEVQDRLEHSALSLSGGQQQRLCLARCLALRPQILLLDEPSASLDFRANRRIEELLMALEETYPMIVVSHSPAQAERLADAAVIFESGRVIHRLEKPDIHRGLLEDLIDR